MENKPKQILIIEDDATLRDILKDSLTGEGYAIVEAQSGEEGLSRGLASHPDLILLDILLSDEDGLTVLKKIRADEVWGKHVKVIMLTNLSDNQSVAAALDLGAHSFLVKSDWKIQDVMGVIHDELKDWPD
jgi:DNA-binding response OmpR family regulator